MGCEKAAKTDFIVPKPANTHRPQPNKAVTGNGMGSVIHITTTQVKMAANVRGGSESESGRNRNISPARIGATTKPNRCGDGFSEELSGEELIHQMETNLIDLNVRGGKPLDSVKIDGIISRIHVARGPGWYPHSL